MKITIKKSICFLALASIALNASANLSGKMGRLFSAHEWNQMCASLEEPDLITMCKSKIYRGVAYGRSLGTFEPVVPENRALLQSRSGVFFKSSLNDMVSSVREDSGMRTRVVLHDDVVCQAYASAPDLVGTPRVNYSYRRLIDAWLREYTDATHDAPSVKVATVDSRKTLQFDVLTVDNRIVSGMYAFDEKANAGIFTTCDHPADSAAARRNAAQFFRSVVGSARKFG